MVKNFPEDSLEKLFVLMAETRNDLQSIVERFDEYLSHVGSPLLSGPEDPKRFDSLSWKDGRGSKGPYQMVMEKDVKNTDQFSLFNHLRNIVKANANDQGKFTYSIGPWYYWLGQHLDIIFRRPRKRGAY